MPKFTLEIDCGNAAFHDSRGEFSPEPELVYILMELAGQQLTNKMLRPRGKLALRDSNGNHVGTAQLHTR